MKKQTQNARFDENETDHLIANYGANLSPEKWHDLQSFLTGQKEQFIANDREREANARDKSNRSR
jgi:hypothetical protein